MYIVLLGAPGAGKGTQAAKVASELKLAHVATGDLFRRTLEQGGELGNEVKSYMDKGMLVPNELTVRMVLERLAASDCANGVILDGFPRNLAQAEALDEALAANGKAIDEAVYINVSEDEVLKRLGGRLVCRQCQMPYHVTQSPPKVEGKCDKCGGELYQRADDNEETIKNRLKVYHDETSPLIDYYRKADKLIEVEGSGDAAAITEEIVTALRK